DGRRLASASADGSVRLWDTTTGRPLHVWRGHETRRPAQDRIEAGARALDITPDGRWVLSAGSLREERIKLWDASTGREARSIPLPGPERGERARRVFDLRISPDGARASGLFGARFFDAHAAGDAPPKVTYKLATWDLKTGKLLACRPIET